MIAKPLETPRKDAQRYYVPAESPWPFIGSIGLSSFVLGAVGIFQNAQFGWWFFLGGSVVLTYMLSQWFFNIFSENTQGLYSKQLNRSFKWGMSWFIFSEVMFFGAFFAALFYARVFSVPWLGGEGDKAISHMLWPDFKTSWPLLLPPNPDLFTPIQEAMGPFPLPALNTIILLVSGVTLTIAHSGLKKQHRRQLIFFLSLTVLLGLSFLSIQMYEYTIAYQQLGITLGSGIYGTLFFTLTGFHGIHVCIGTLMLFVMLVRSLKGHFTPDNHFAFEAAAWYWHFVDVVWLGLFVFVYWL